MTEGERLYKLETQMQNIEDKVDHLTDVLEGFINNSDAMFAAKWVERAVWGGAAVVGGGLILALLYSVLKAPVQLP